MSKMVTLPAEGEYEYEKLKIMLERQGYILIFKPDSGNMLTFEQFNHK